jgi:hypothetical protein
VGKRNIKKKKRERKEIGQAKKERRKRKNWEKGRIDGEESDNNILENIRIVLSYF